MVVKGVKPGVPDLRDGEVPFESLEENSQMYHQYCLPRGWVSFSSLPLLDSTMASFFLDMPCGAALDPVFG